MEIWVKSSIDLSTSQFLNLILLLLAHVLLPQLEKQVRVASRQLKLTSTPITISSVEIRSITLQKNKELIFLSLDLALSWAIIPKHYILVLLQFSSLSCPAWRTMVLLYHARCSMTQRIRLLLRGLNRSRSLWVTAISSKLKAVEYLMVWSISHSWRREERFIVTLICKAPSMLSRPLTQDKIYKIEENKSA